MKIVKPNAVYLDAADHTPYQFIEKCGRTCYKSEDKITDDSAVEFVKNLAGRGHWAMLEHAYVYAKHPDARYIVSANMKRELLRYVNICCDTNNGYLTASMRALFELFQAKDIPVHIKASFGGLKKQLKAMYPEVFGTLEDDEVFPVEDWQIMTRWEFIDDVKANSKDPDAVFECCLPHTILFTVDRGVTHELVRHRPASFAQESTRYANYSKGKFGSEITVVEPWWVEKDGSTPDGKPTKQYEAWTAAMMAAEQIYIYMTKELGTPAQLARAVLPQSVKADIIVTATEKEWKHIINLRVYGTTGAPHPDMRRAMLIAAPQLRQHSEGRLYPADYMPVKGA